MNYEELKTALPEVAASAHISFGSKVNDMTFLPKENGCASFQKAGEYFLWYWFDNVKWKDTHMLRGENWLYQEAK